MTATLRTATENDASQIAAIYAPLVASSAVSFEVEPPDEAEMRRRFLATAGEMPWLVCDGDACLHGFALSGRHRQRSSYQWSVEVSVYVAAGRRRAGVGRALYTALFEILRLQGFHTALAGIALPNAASVGLHEALGFEPVGVYRNVGYKLGAWRDVGWWQLALLPPAASPPPPRPFASVRDAAGVAAALAGGAAALRPLREASDAVDGAADRLE